MCELPSTTGGMSTTASVPTVHWHTGRPMSSDASWAMEMWKAKNASHISTALTTAARYTRPQHQTEKLQLWLDEKTGAGQSRCAALQEELRQGIEAELPGTRSG